MTDLAHDYLNLDSLFSAEELALRDRVRAFVDERIRPNIARWYETAETRQWPDQAWRDPWVFREQGTWHMLTTARANHGEPDDRGVIGHATSSDLTTWTVQPPLSQPGAGFGHIEVVQTVLIDGRPVGLFSCLGSELSHERRLDDPIGGVWAFPADSLAGPFRTEESYRITD